jgi:hypothetical protein
MTWTRTVRAESVPAVCTGLWVQTINVRGGVGLMNCRGRSYTRGAKQRRREFFGELAVRTDRKQIGRGIDINHGHWRLLEG